MICQRARDVFPELLDSRTPATAHLDARGHLANCPECQREFAALTQTASALDAMPTLQPSPRLRQNFYAMLEEEKHSAASVRAVAEREHRARRAILWRRIISPLAACALLLLGFTLGQRTVPEPALTTPPADDATKREIVALREQMSQQRDQLSDMQKLVTISILQQQQNPANERLRDVLAAAKSDNPSPKVLEDLILALALDPSANVRLRAIEALYSHAEREVVRAGVLNALPREQNPLVQLELIDFVATAQDYNAAPVLEKISADESADRTVRDAAKLALARL
jgi:hypothetical protein